MADKDARPTTGRDYVAGKVRAAVAQCRGDRQLAQRLLLRLCARDEALLRALTAPFLTGIVAHAVQRFAPDDVPASAPAGTRPSPRRPATAQQPATLSSAALDAVIGQLGRRIGTSTAPQGLAAILNPQAQPKAGAAHEQSLRTLARAFARKRLEG